MLHDILRTEVDDLSVLKKNDDDIFSSIEYYVYWLKSSCFELSGDGNTVFFWAKKLMERWYLQITGKVLFWTFRGGKYGLFVSRKVDGKIIFTDC